MVFYPSAHNSRLLPKNAEVFHSRINCREWSHVQDEAGIQFHLEPDRNFSSHSHPFLNSHLVIFFECVWAQVTSNKLACLPLICVHKQWPGRGPAPSSASTPPGWGRCQWPGSRSSCWLWGWRCQPAGGARCAGTPPCHWPTPAAVSHPDQ